MGCSNPEALLTLTKVLHNQNMSILDFPNPKPLLCPFNIASDIFTLKKDIAKMHYSNAGLNIPDNAPLTVY